MLNRDVNALVRHLSVLARETFGDPPKYAVVMRTVRAIGLALKEQNPNFNINNFEQRIASRVQGKHFK